MRQTITLGNRKFYFERYPANSDASLRAWDAADEYIHEYLGSQHFKSLVIFNDAFGFLTLTLQDYRPHTISDSACSHMAVRQNAEHNDISGYSISYPDANQIPGKYDLAVIKIPKSLELLEYEIRLAASVLKSGGRVVLGGMSRHIHTSTTTLISRYFKDVTTSLAKKKSRLAFASGLKADTFLPGPDIAPVIIVHDITLQSNPGVFSSRQIDPGTKFLLENLTVPPGTQTVIDLGCGNGIVGIYTARHYPVSHVIFTDDSYLAVQSARENWQENIQSSVAASFHIQHGLTETDSDSADLIITNPPFHQGFTNTQQIAIDFFTDAFRVLKPGGTLQVVANNHLGYMHTLKTLFGSAAKIARNDRYTMYSAQKTK